MHILRLLVEYMHEKSMFMVKNLINYTKLSNKIFSCQKVLLRLLLSFKMLYLILSYKRMTFLMRVLRI